MCKFQCFALIFISTNLALASFSNKCKPKNIVTSTEVECHHQCKLMGAHQCQWTAEVDQTQASCTACITENSLIMRHRRKARGRRDHSLIAYTNNVAKCPRKRHCIKDCSAILNAEDNVIYLVQANGGHLIDVYCEKAIIGSAW